MTLSKKTLVDQELHSTCTNHMVLLDSEQQRQERVLAQLTVMLTDLIKVNL